MTDAYVGNGHGLLYEANGDTDTVLAQIRSVLQNLRFGSVTIIVQDGVVVQIDRTEKRRVQPGARRTEGRNNVGTPSIKTAIIAPYIAKEPRPGHRPEGLVGGRPENKPKTSDQPIINNVDINKLPTKRAAQHTFGVAQEVVT